MNINNLVEACKLISEDAKNDAKEFDGQPFNGKTVATYLGYQGAAISVLSKILQQVLISFKNEKE